jgi:hypothetical protein
MELLFTMIVWTKSLNPSTHEFILLLTLTLTLSVAASPLRSLLLRRQELELGPARLELPGRATLELHRRLELSVPSCLIMISPRVCCPSAREVPRERFAAAAPSAPRQSLR